MSDKMGYFFATNQIGLNCGFLFAWEVRWKRDELVYLRLIQKVFGSAIQNLFSSLPICLYFLLGRLLIANYQSFAKFDQEHSMQQLDRLIRFYGLLNHRFGFALLAVTFSCFSSTITSSFFVIRSLVANQPVVVLWNVFQIVENMAKVVLICYTADRQLESVV